MDGEGARIYVAGGSSGAGKSTFCVALLAELLGVGIPPEHLGYVKPVTQGVQPTLVTRFCAARGIAHRGIGPVVFHRGFTQQFLDGRTKSTEAMLAEVSGCVNEIARGKRLTLVDGVGYAAVGSIVGVSNADVARAVGASVIMVGRQGLGDAVDSFNLAAAFFEQRGVRVLGTVINRIEAAMMAKTRGVLQYFAQHRPAQKVYALVPEVEALALNQEAAACFVPKVPPAEAPEWQRRAMDVQPATPAELELCSAAAEALRAAGFDAMGLLKDAQE